MNLMLCWHTVEGAGGFMYYPREGCFTRQKPLPPRPHGICHCYCRIPAIFVGSIGYVYQGDIISNPDIF